MRWNRFIGNTLYWLYPGLKIKRWLLLAVGGFGAVLLGFTLLVGPDLLHYSDKLIQPLLKFLIGSAYSGLLLLLGLVMIILGLRRAAEALREALILSRSSCDDKKTLIEVLFTKRYLENGPRVVTIGGGTGLSNLLRELKEYTSNLTAVVTVTDDGGSSGRLRGELGILPPGDIRSCLLAMADTEPIMEKLFEHRFQGGAGLEGHSFGNLFIAAMTEMFGFQEAVRHFGRVMAIRGRVFPVTLDMVQLEAEDTEGRLTRGQSVLYHRKGSLKRIALSPAAVKPLPEVLAAIAGADAIILGPGSLFTSIIPNLLVPGMAEAILKTRALVFYVCNVTTQPGETTGFSAADHVQALLDHVPAGLLDYIVVNSDLSVPRVKLEHLAQQGAALVRPDYKRLTKLAPQVISGYVINHTQITRHDGRRLAEIIVDQVRSGGRRTGEAFGKDASSILTVKSAAAWKNAAGPD
ncbi:MAG: gluconeogenesis factor YvcK family protein [Bacillota bacterium]